MQRVALGDSASVQAITRVNAQQAKNNCRSRPDFFTGKAADDGEGRANKLHRTYRGNGDGMYA